jgi:hypothetical protein
MRPGASSRLDEVRSGSDRRRVIGEGLWAAVGGCGGEGGGVLRDEATPAPLGLGGVGSELLGLVSGVSTPCTDRGVASGGTLTAEYASGVLRVGIDYFRFTDFDGPVSVWARLRSLMVRDDFRELDHGFWGYGHCSVNSEGVQVHWGVHDHCHVIVPGKACRAMVGRGGDLWGAFCSWSRRPEIGVRENGKKILAPCGVQFSRVDIAFDGWEDDRGEVIQPRDLYDSVRADVGVLRCRCQRKNVRVNAGVLPLIRRKNDADLEELEDDGDTLYVGSRLSDRYVRIYDKHGFCRVELEAHHDACEVWREYLEVTGERDFVKFVVGQLRDYMAFVESSERPDRAPEQAWWRRCLGDFEALRLRMVRRVVDVPKSVMAVRSLLRRSGGLLADLVAALDAEGGLAALAALLPEGVNREVAEELTRSMQGRGLSVFDQWEDSGAWGF